MVESKKLSIGLYWILSGSTIQAVAQLLVSGILARILTPGDFGAIAICMIVIGFTDMMMQMGLGASIVKENRKVDDAEISSALLFSVLMGIIVMGLLIVASMIFECYLRENGIYEVMQYLAILFPIKSASQIYLATLQKDLYFKKMAGIETASYIIGYGCIGIIMAVSGFGIWSLVAGLVTQSLLSLIMLSIASKFKLTHKVRWLYVSKLMEYGSSFTIGRVWNYLALKGDYIIISKLLGTTELGLYSKAYSLMAAPNTIVGKAINTVHFPNLTKNANDTKEIGKVLIRWLNTLFILVLPITAYCWVMAEPIIKTLLGDQWGGSVQPFKILVLGMVFRVGYKLTGLVAMAAGDIKRFSTNQLIYMVSVFGGGFAGCSFGINGVALGVNLALVVVFILLTVQACEIAELSIKDILYPATKPIVMSLAFCIILSNVYYNYLSNVNDILTLMMTGPFLLIFIKAVHYFSNTHIIKGKTI